MLASLWSWAGQSQTQVFWWRGSYNRFSDRPSKVGGFHKVLQFLPSSKTTKRQHLCHGECIDKFCVIIVYSCIDTYVHSCLKLLLNERKQCSNNQIHVQIMELVCCLNMTSLGLFAWHYVTKRWGPEWAFWPQRCKQKWRLWRLILHADAILYKEIQHTTYHYFNVFLAFLNWNQVKCKNNDHTFVSVHEHLRGPLEDVWKLGLAASCSNSFLGTRQMLMHEKKIWSLQCVHLPTVPVVSDQTRPVLYSVSNCPGTQ